MLPLVIGDDFIRIAAVKHADGSPYPLGGCAIWWTVAPKRGVPDSEAVAQLYWDATGISHGITVDDPSSGELVVRLTPEQTAQLTQRAYYYDLQIDDPAGRIVTPDRGVLSARWSPTTRITSP